MLDIKRNLGAKIDRLLSQFPIVIIIGARQVGKTTLSKILRPNWTYFDLEKGSDYDLITRDFDFFFAQYPNATIIDEAQRSGQLFNELRGVVDQNRKLKNRFILTGSNSFELLKNVSESLPGRAAIVELGTLKANELLQKPMSKFYSIFIQTLNKSTIRYLQELSPNLTDKEIQQCFFWGGYPDPALEKDISYYQTWMNQYFTTYIERDIRTLFPRLDSIKYRRFISMLGALSGTIINRADVGRSLNINEVSIRDYLDIAAGTMMWRNIPSYEKSTIKSIYPFQL